jgi:hypothetical protein
VHIGPFPAVTVRPKVPISLATFRFDAIPEQFNLPMLDMYRNYTDIPGQIAAWRDPFAPVRLDFSIDIHSRGNSILPVSVSSWLSFPTITNTTVDVGYVLAESELMPAVEIPNPFICSIVLHSQYFDGVANAHSRSIFHVPVSLTEPGKFEVIFPVTTNLTAPFYVFLRGVAVTPRIGFLDATGNILKAAMMDPDTLETIIFLRNYGRTAVNMSEPELSSPKFKFKTNCTRVLEQRGTCRVAIEGMLGMMELTTETVYLTVVAHRSEFVLEMTVEFSEEVLKRIRMKRWAHRGVVKLFLFSPMFNYVLSLVKSIFGWYRARKRHRQWLHAVRELTVPATADVELQVEVGGNNRQSSGIWERVQHRRVVATRESLAEMEVFISSVV